VRTRLLLATALALPLLGGVASADLRDDCWELGLGFRVSALVCNKIPGGIG
jgi:hypothetical protein